MDDRPIVRTPTWLSRNVVLLSLSSLFGDVSTEMLYPILPVFLTQVLGANGSIIGLIEGVAQATQSVIQGLSGSMSDRLQRRKPIALAGFLLAALSKPLVGLSITWTAVLGARFLDRIGAGARSAPRDALIAASASESDRGKAFGLEGLGDNLGAFIGPLVSVFLLAVLVDMRIIFYLALIPGLLACVMVLMVREERTTTNLVSAKLSLSLGRFPPSYWRYLVAVAIFGVGNSSSAFLILQSQSAGVSVANTVLIYAGFNLVAALVSYPVGALSDRVGRRTLLLAGLAVLCISYLGFGLGQQAFVIAVSFAGYGVYQGISRAVGKSLAADLVPETLRASGIGWYSAVLGLSQLIASVVAGLLWDHVGHTAPFFWGAWSAVAGATTLAALVRARSITRDSVTTESNTL